MPSVQRVEFSAHLCYNRGMKVKVYAKLNLTLAVAARQGQFHPIDSVVTSVDVFDTVQVTPRGDGAVTLQCDLPLPAEANSAYRAAEAFVCAFGSCGADISVVKGIPEGAGMGGSSADAAAVVYCMCKLFGVDVRSAAVHELCARLGSDVNFMLCGGLAQMRGKGDDLTFSALARPLYFALTTFDVQLSTAQVYAEYDKLFADATLPVYPQDVLDPLHIFAGDVSVLPADKRLGAAAVLAAADLGGQCFNDLESAAQQLDGYAKLYLAFAGERFKCTMTGSGSAYYVLFTSRSAAEQAAELLNSAGFCTRVCRSVPTGIQIVDDGAEDCNS